MDYQNQLNGILNYLQNIFKVQSQEGISTSFFQEEVKKLRDHHLFVIPTQGKRPLHKFLTEENKELANKQPIRDEAGLILTDWLSVVDIDNVEEFEKETGISREELERLATVKTGKGYHFYIADFNSEINGRKPNWGDILKGGNRIVILPGSRFYHEKLQREVCYLVLNPVVYTKERLIKTNPKFEKIFKQERKEQRRGGGGKEGVIVDFEALKQLLDKHYFEGRRQNLALFTSGWLAKLGVDYETAQDFIKKLAEEHQDEEINQRVAAVEITYRKYQNNEEIKGFEGLRELGINEEELWKCIKKIQKSRYFIDGNLLYYLSWERGGVKAELIGPALKFNYILYNLEEQKRQLHVSFDRFEYLDLKLEKEHIEHITKIPILNQKLYKYYLAEQIERLEKQKNYRYTINRTGWFSENEDLFILPNQPYEHIIVDHPEGKRFYINEKDKHHQLILHSLKTASDLGVLYTCAVASILLRDLKCRGFAVYVSGPAGVGKTTACKLACNLFYDCNQEIDLFGTKTAKERILYAYRDLPFLLNEAATTKDEFIQELLFMVESGQTKKRSNIKLTYNFQQIQNVLFLTSERELKTDRLGAERRQLKISLTERIPLPIPLQEALKLIGAGVDYVEFYIKNKREFLAEVDELEKQVNQYYQLPILLALIILEEFYQEKFHNLRKKFQDLFDQQFDPADYLEYCLEKLEGFILLYFGNFLAPQMRGKDQEDLPKSIYGYIEINNGELHIKLTPTAFDKFLKENNIDRKSFLEITEKHKMLTYNEKKKTYKFRMGPNQPPLPVSRVYYFKVPSEIIYPLHELKIRLEEIGEEEYKWESVPDYDFLNI